MKEKENVNKGLMYVFDINKILDFVLINNDDKNSDSQITENYDSSDEGKMILTNRQISEIKNSGNDNITTIRYDLIKLFINELSNMPQKLDVESSLGANIIFNTMINEKFIKITKVE